MTDTLATGLVVLATILGGALTGMVIGRRLPTHHANDETKRIISLAMAVVGTVSALVLGLLISSANNSFIERGREVTRVAADVLRIDQMLRLYGPETSQARQMLRQYTAKKTADLFPTNPGDQPELENQSTYELLQKLEILVLDLQPTNHRQQWLADQALSLSAEIGNTRWLLIARAQQSTPKGLLGLVVLWLTLLFASFGLFAERNLTLVITLTLCAIAASGAVGVILELEQPFSGFFRISSLPMRHAIEVLSQ